MKKKFISTLLAVVTVASVAAAIPVSAACSDWTFTGDQYYLCLEGRCGLAWMFPRTAYLEGTQVRYCDVNGEQKQEVRLYSEKDGCCADV